MSANDEIKDLRAERDALEDNALIRSRRALATIKGTEDVAQDTLSTLQSQGEQLAATELKAREMDANTQKNYIESKKVKKYGKFLNFSFTTFLNRKKKKIDKDFDKAISEIETSAGKDKVKQRERILAEQIRKEQKMRNELSVSNASAPAKTASIPHHEKTEKEREIDRNLKEISMVTKNLGKMAMDMSDELDVQKVNISKIGALNKHAEETLTRSEAKIEKYT